NLESIVIIEFIPNDKTKEFQEKFSKYFGIDISPVESHLVSWRELEYLDTLDRLGKDKGIPESLSDIQLIQVRHLTGVAQELILKCNIDKTVFEKQFDKFYEEYIRGSIRGQLISKIKEGVDYSEVKFEIENVLEGVDLKDKYNFENEFKFDFKEQASILKNTIITKEGYVLQNDYFNARLKFIEKLQKDIETFFQDVIPGICLSKREKCPSMWIYDLSNLDIDIVKKAKDNSILVKDVHEWKSKFEFKLTPQYLESDYQYHGTNLSLIGWTSIDETYESVSLLGKRFIIGLGSMYKQSFFGGYKSNYVILKLKKDSGFQALGGLGTESALSSISKFIFPTEWIKHRYSMLLELSKTEKDIFDMEYVYDINKMSSELDNRMKYFNEENKKRLESISIISKISDDLQNLNSLIKTNPSFLEEDVDDNFERLSVYLNEDSKLWRSRIKDEMNSISEKQSLKIQYLHDTINT
ncbi:MAG: hypothetical protein KAT05_09670, partial [Spirochaetes bacterium]|nr:hypothetical protein [Spirochaetota bacterium]